MKVLVTKMYYSNTQDGVLVHVFGRDELGNRVYTTLRGIEPCFWVDQEPKDDADIVRVERDGRDLYNNPLWKIVTITPSAVRDLRADYPVHYEADIPFDRRVRFDLGIKGVIEIPDPDDRGIYPELRPSDIHPVEGVTIVPRVQVLDIERIDKNDKMSFDGEIRCITVYDYFSDKYLTIVAGKVNEQRIDQILVEQASKNKENFLNVKIIQVDTPRQLYDKLMKFWGKHTPDIITGWYVDKYDVEEMKKDFGFSVKDVVIFDLMTSYAKIHEGELQSKALDFVGHKELGFGKLPKNHKDLEELVAYNVWDVHTTRRINDKRRVIDYFMSVATTAGCQLEKTTSYSVVADHYILHRLGGVARLPSKEYHEKREKVVGSFVHEAREGVFHNVVVIDFKAEYPSAIQSLNISPETKVEMADVELHEIEHYTAPNGTMFLKEPRGLLPRILDEMLEKKDRLKVQVKKLKGEAKVIKKEEYNAFKNMVNTTYGVLASEHFRMADTELANAITAMAREHIKWCLQILTDFDHVEVLYCDTDSIFFCLTDGTDDLDKINAIISDITGTFDDFYSRWGGSPGEHTFVMSPEKIMSPFLMSLRSGKDGSAKKKYAGLLTWEWGLNDWESRVKDELDDRLYVRGFQVRRSDASDLTNEVQKKVLLMILNDEPVEEVLGVVRCAVCGIRDDSLIPKCGIPKAVKQEHYSSRFEHVRAMQYANMWLGKTYRVGDKPKMFFIKGWDHRQLNDQRPETDVIGLDWDENPLDYHALMNYDNTIRRVLQLPLQNLISLIGISWDEVMGLATTDKLEGWF